MEEDFFDTFDYYNAPPPRESAAPPPEEASVPAPEDEFNEQVHTTAIKHKKAKSIAAMLALSGLAVSFMTPGASLIPSADDLSSESTVIESSVPESNVTGPEVSAVATTAATPTPAPTPVPLPTEDLGLRLDSFKMYPLDKGYLAEIRFTLATNSGTVLSSITGTLDSDLFIYDGYNSKTKKVRSHYEKYHQDFSMETAGLATGSGVNNTEKQYTAFVKVPVDATSEDKFSLTLTVSNTLNGKKTEDKTASLKDIALWNDSTDTYAAYMVDVETAKNGSSFELTVTPKDGVTVKGLSITGIDIFAKKGSSFLELKDCKYEVAGSRITVSSKKKSVPSNGDLYYKILVEFEMTDSAGTTFTGKGRFNGSFHY